MLYKDYTRELLGLKDVIVTNVDQNDNEIIIHIQIQKMPHNCPRCNSPTNKVHDYREQKIKDIAFCGKKTYLLLKKRRFACSQCSKRFYERNTFLPRYHRMTSRLVHYILSELRETYSMTTVSKKANVSVPTVCRVFNYVSYTNKSLPQVLSIDEFKGNAGTKYQCILTDPHNKRVLDILKSRESSDLCDYFKRFDNRNNVKYFVMDMWKPYREIAETFFKNATIVIDKYHFIRQILWAFERVRKSEQKKFLKQRRIYFKQSKRLLLKRMRYLTDYEKSIVESMLRISPRLKEAYLLKEKFYEFVDSKDLCEAKKNLKAWYLYIGIAQIPEFNECLKTISNWEKYILNSFICPYTNGFTEGVNNKIKVLKRNAYGLRNFGRFRSRILHVMAG
ncbi:MAG: ISL3 family transposase [Clostridiaceae bacterium]|nr:ISL3 family transposase [Clostridiaceae bacterium]